MLLAGRLFTGTAVEFWEDGSVASELPFRFGIQHGVMRSWYPGGQLQEETPYVSGRVRGVSRRWHPNGVLAEELTVGESGTEERLVRFTSAGVPTDDSMP
jgi:antitoxin component YwqK of YwqJK toxin-antitoxin module